MFQVRDRKLLSDEFSFRSHVMSEKFAVVTSDGAFVSEYSILVMKDDLLGFTARDRDFMGSGDVTARPRTSDGWKPGQRIGLHVRQLLKKKSKSVFMKN